jgi:hypothetical protein
MSGRLEAYRCQHPGCERPPFVVPSLAWDCEKTHDHPDQEEPKP